MVNEVALLRTSRSLTITAAYSRGQDIGVFEVGIVGEHVIDAGNGGELAEDHADGHAQAPDPIQCLARWEAGTG